MILVDTGPFVALFDPQDAEHERCKDRLRCLRKPMLTTTPVLTKKFHLLTPNSIGADRLRDSSGRQHIRLVPGPSSVGTHLRTHGTIADQRIDLADASLIVAATLRATKIFTLDRSDFRMYRIRRGHHHLKADLLP